MLNSPLDISSYYPFLPVPSLTDTMREIKDILVVVQLPAVDPIKATNAFSAELLNINDSSATVKITSAVYGYTSNITVPVIRPDAYPSSASYIVAEAGCVASNLNYEIHPDCLRFVQEAPSLYFLPAVCVPGTVGNNSVNVSAPFLLGGTIRISNGYNVAVANLTSGVTFTGASGAGEGLAPLSLTAYSEADLYDGARLRSINGISGSIDIKGSSTINIQSTTGVDASGNLMLNLILQPLYRK